MESINILVSKADQSTDVPSRKAPRINCIIPITKTASIEMTNIDFSFGFFLSFTK